MNSTYGDLLLYFRELFEDIAFYTQEPTERGGYRNKEEVGTFQCIYQADQDESLFGPDTIVGRGGSRGAQDYNDMDVVWTQDKLEIGWFFERNDHVFKIVKESAWNKEAGFWRYKVEKVGGDTGKQQGVLPLAHGVF